MVILREMKMSNINVVGTFHYLGNKELYYMDEHTFYYDSEFTKPVSLDNLEFWAVGLNSPWSQLNEKYIISVNCEDAYHEVSDMQSLWKCEYQVRGYDNICSSIFGYGATEEEALIHCKSLFLLVQESYNKESESF